MWNEITDRVKEKSDFIFLEKFEGPKSTRMMTQAWKSTLNGEMSGHSARRSGAMMYVRAGLPLQEVAFLGRWKSNIVLTYAEEALEEVLANQRIMPAPGAAGVKDFSGWKSPRTPKPAPTDMGCGTPVPMTPLQLSVWLRLREAATSWWTWTMVRRTASLAWTVAR